jgi:hypothetical protein
VVKKHKSGSERFVCSSILRSAGSGFIGLRGKLPLVRFGSFSYSKFELVVALPQLAGRLHYFPLKRVIGAFRIGRGYDVPWAARKENFLCGLVFSITGPHMPDHNITVATELANSFRADQHNAAIIYAALMICETIREEAKKTRRVIGLGHGKKGKGERTARKENSPRT